MECKHDKWIVTDKSNVLQLNYNGNPFRLCICRCAECGTHEMQWVESDVKELEELATGESVLLKWDFVLDEVTTYRREPLTESDVIAESDIDVWELLGKQDF